jgi:hypothetical protein
MVTSSADRKSLLVILSTFLFVVLGTTLVIFLARGYRIDFKNGTGLQSTGLLSATSLPKSASVYLNDKLVTATDDTLNLSPGNYSVKIVKDGYLPWQKNIQIKKEVVFQTDTILFRSSPDLKPITLSGAINPAITSDDTKIIYAVASASASKDNGLYVIDLNSSPLPLYRSLPRQLATDFPGINWSKFTFTSSPDSKSFIAASKNQSFLISFDSPISARSLFDITPKLSAIKEDWSKQLSQIIEAKLSRLPDTLKNSVSTASSKYIQFSTDDSKLLYLAKATLVLPQNLISPPPAQSTQLQTRSLQKDYWYIYDLKDDTNFLIGSQNQLQNPLWLPNTNHLLFVENDQVKVVDYDSTNKNTIFAGTFDKNIVNPWSDGTRIVTLTSAYLGAPENLYSITIR